MLRRYFSTIVFFTLASLGLSLPAASQDAPVPDRRFVVTPNVDFYGADLQAIFNTSYDACRRTCYGNPDCAAFTYNTKSKACFPKSAISDQTPFDGAYSARVLATEPRVLGWAESRRADLGFMTDYAIRKSHDLALRIGSLHPAGAWDAAALLDSARSRETEGDLPNALRWTGAALSLSDAADLWNDYARLSLDQPKGSSSDTSRNTNRAVYAAVNGYLRAPSDAGRVSSLMLLSQALERDGQGRNALHAMRLAEEIQPRQDVMTALDRLVGKYGFRVTEHRADNESAAPRICAEFSEPLAKAGVDYATYLRLPDPGLAVEADGNQLCIDGVDHGARYTITLRKGLPSDSGETLIRDTELSLYVRDRSPSVGFPGRAYVLPRAAEAALPIETVNLDEIELSLHRVSDRNLLRTMQQEYFGRPLSEYEIKDFTNEIAEEVWTGTGAVQNELNQTMTTRLPLGEVLADMAPGIYTLHARIDGIPLYDDPGATQWFVLTDLGLTTLKGTDGLHVFARGLSDAAALDGIELTLLSRSNRELARATTDAEGHARFDPGLTRGTDGAAPAMVLARRGETDFAFLSLTDPGFDLSDRGVEGRAPSGPIDLFLATDRGAYRAGEVIHATALARTSGAGALHGLPLTAILTRPDGVEYARHISAEDRAGGHVFALPIGASAPRGTWRLEIKADVDAPALASQSLLVEDFLPERIDFTQTLPDAPLRPGDTTTLTIDARYLFGAPGAGLLAEGSVRLKPLRKIDEAPGYVFGRHDARVYPGSSYFDAGPADAQGRMQATLELPTSELNDRPYEAELITSVKEGSGRPVERVMTRKLAPSGTVLGIKPGFDQVAAEGSNAAFEVIALGPDLIRRDAPVSWTLNRVTTRYQWYQQYGNWNWEPITTRQRVATGEGRTGTDPLAISAPVDWGRYELVVETGTGQDYVSASEDFYAGWYAPADASGTPDTLELSLDKPGYRPGETAELRLVPRFAGTALITVMSHHVIDMRAVPVTEGENLVSLPVTDEWGTGAYVTAQVIRPMDVAAGQNPARALGLSHAAIEPGDKALSVRIDAPAQTAPRGPLAAKVAVEGLAEGDTGFVTLAAVDLGILNLTGFQSPDPQAHYFGQRRLGVEIRDLYGRLIDGMNGAPGQVRSGGDAGNRMSREAPPPTEELVAYFTGPLTLGPDGTAEAQFDLPDFNGTVRLMAIAWSARAVGASEADVVVRDPVVVSASLPRFLAPGDSARMLLELIHTEGPAGDMALAVSAPEGLALGSLPATVTLAETGKETLALPLQAREEGDHEITVSLTTPAGATLVKTVTLPVRRNDPAVSATRQIALAAGQSLTLDADIFAGMQPGSGQAVLSAGPLAQLNAPALLQSLDRYPYGCTEQVTSQALPLLYFNDVAQALDLGTEDQITARIDAAITRVLTRQSSNGGFGLWRAGSGDFWLDAYVGDFLSRARAAGHAIPDHAFTMAMDNLRNRVNYAPDFDDGGEDIAYALMVLAREGAAKMGDLRYYADVKSEAFATPLALAQLGAALASYGDQTRADRMFAKALIRVAQTAGTPERQLWRADYGTRARDRAGVAALMHEAGSTAGGLSALTAELVQPGQRMSTQEQSWTLLAAHALIDDPARAGLTLNGTAVTGALVRLLEADTMTPQLIANTSSTDTRVTLTTIGVPERPEPAGGYGYQIARSYFTTDGQPVTLNAVAAGTRLMAVLTVTPAGETAGRLMIDDPLPAGLEIDNPNILRSGQANGLDWLQSAPTETAEYRSDRFLAAVNWSGKSPFRLAYMVRAVTPGSFHHPAATVEDMYRPAYRAHSDTGRMTVTAP
ncbi:alpha-2-macroglobulin family protein [Roseovarius sp. C7]|uniref:alpha-2-macroglobulin family protein n=1 Tax=Roseovarius sp. C7 TaxID=3398643 RepID=UPI0039F67CA7